MLPDSATTGLIVVAGFAFIRGVEYGIAKAGRARNYQAAPTSADVSCWFNEDHRRQIYELNSSATEQAAILTELGKLVHQISLNLSELRQDHHERAKDSQALMRDLTQKFDELKGRVERLQRKVTVNG